MSWAGWIPCLQGVERISIPPSCSSHKFMMAAGGRTSEAETYLQLHSALYPTKSK